MKWLAWTLWLLTLSALVFILSYGAPRLDEPREVPVLVAFSVFLLAFATVGALVGAKRPRNSIGWIMLAAGLAYALGGLSAAFATADAGPLVVREWIGAWAWGLGFALAATFLLLLFPNGSLPSPRWRPVAWIAGLSTLALVLGEAFQPELETGEGPVENPLGAGGVGGEVLAALPYAIALILLASLASAASLVVRYRRAGPDERHQLKWLTYAGAIVALALVVTALVGAFGAPTTANENLQYVLLSGGVTSVPIAIGVAVFRYRLYDIDFIINRTLVYVPLIGIIGGLATITIPVSQRLFTAMTGDESDVAVVLTALVVAFLVTPVRKRIEGAVDRRFKPGAGTAPALDDPELEARMRAIAEETARDVIAREWGREDSNL